MRLEKRSAGLFVASAPGVHLVRVQEFSHVMERCPEQDVLWIETGGEVREPRDEFLRRFSDECVVMAKVCGRTQPCEQGEGIVDGQKQDLDKSKPEARGCLSAGLPTGDGFSEERALTGLGFGRTKEG